MSREIRRVPLDFDWPIDKVWEGYLTPERFREDPCPSNCDGGWSPHAKALKDLWYGNLPFHPVITGSTPLTADSPAVRAFAERNIGNSPDFYGSGERAIQREGRRLAELWNAAWCYHLTQEDVDVLLAAGRLMDFTRVPLNDEQRADVAKKRAEGGNSWLPYDNGHHPTAAEVNEWSLGGFGHDSLNQSIVCEARCVRDGQPRVCAACDGHGSVERYKGQRDENEKWHEEDHEPPNGEGWQVWETVSEGSPISPVFADSEQLVLWLMSPAYSMGASRPLTREQAEAFVGDGFSVGSFVVAGGRLIPGDAAVYELSKDRADRG